MYPVHIILMALTIRAKVKLTAGTVIRYTGNYLATAPVLGVVLADAEAGELASIGTKGLYHIKVAPSQTFAVGDPVALNAAGQAITGATGVAYVFESQPSSVAIIL